MSQAEVKRFIADLKAKPQLLAAVKGKATGLAAVVAFATSAGYGITAADARDYVRGLTLQNLSDAHLDQLAGGKGPSKSSSVQQSVQMTTTAVQVAEAVVAAVVVVT
jgi:predicted ribosomally synthesized peptide with nif11-like leader